MVRGQKSILNSAKFLVLPILVCTISSATFADVAKPSVTPATSVPTFTKDVAPIVFKQCAECHRPGEVAPFPLLSYTQVRKHAKEIVDVTQNRQMPPWKAFHGYGDFIGERRLTDQQIATIAAWANGGKPEGNSADLPPLPKFTEGWSAGQPDMVVKVPHPFQLQTQGRDQFRVFVIPLNLTEDKYVRAVDFRASNPKVVHHALFFLDNSGRGRELEQEAQDKSGDPTQPGYERTGGPGFRPSGGLGGWAPGYVPEFLPEGVGRPIRKGADLVVQEHFHPSGKAEEEQSMIGLYFTKKPPQKILVTTMHGAPLDIPAGDSNYETTGSFKVPFGVEVSGIIPHAHLLCKEIQVQATLPDGTDLPLIWIKDWDWNWQEQYQYKKPMNIPAGTQVTMRFRYDNSAANPRNPTIPPREVKFGEQTSDEMALVFFQILLDRQTYEMMEANPGIIARLLGGGRGRRAGGNPATQPAADRN